MPEAKPRILRGRSRETLAWLSSLGIDAERAMTSTVDIHIAPDEVVTITIRAFLTDQAIGAAQIETGQSAP